MIDWRRLLRPWATIRELERTEKEFRRVSAVLIDEYVRSGVVSYEGYGISDLAQALFNRLRADKVAAIARADREEALRKTWEEHLGLVYEAGVKFEAERDEARAARDQYKVQTQRLQAANLQLTSKLEDAEARRDELASRY